jgi:hypothetical protein
MAKTKISEYSATAANNTDVESVNIAEGCAPSGINNAIREVMSHLKDFQVGSAGDDLTVGGNFSVTGTVTIPDNAISGDKVEGGTINAITINTLTNTGGTANGVTYLNGSKVLTTGSALTWDAQKFEIVPTSDSFFTGGLRVSRYSGGNLQYGTITNNGNLVLTAVEAAVGTPAITFRTSTDGSTSTEQMRLTSTSLYTASGINVGIGTSSPSTFNSTGGKLVVASGAGNVTALFSDATYYTLGIKHTGVGSEAVGMFGGTSGSALALMTNNTERLRLDTSGNLGLGVTPSAWGAGTSVIDLATSGSAGAVSSSGTLSLANNGFFNGTSWIYKNTSSALLYQLISNEHRWSVAPSGTAGNAISFTQAMTLTADGNLGVGQTSPGAKLELYSTANANFGQKIYHVSTALGTNRFPQIEFAQTPVGQSYQNTVILRQQNSDYGNYPCLALITNAAGAGEATRMFVDGFTGNLGLGVTPSARLTVGTSTSSYAQQFRVGNATTDGFESIYNEAYSLASGGAGSQEFYADVEYRLYSGGVGAKTGVIAWHTAISGTRAERMQINQSGNLLVGTTTFSSGQNGVLMRGTSGGYTDEVLQTRTAGTGSTSATGFYNDNGRVGTISTSGTSTAYNTSSDYRLKEDWVAVADASTRVNALKPVNFAWKVDGSRVDGFLAHEVAEVVPEAITGEKDAVELIDIKDEEGNVTGQEERPVYQGIDQSKLVPLLTAALQEALAEINSLKARLDAANL